jgi:hypothetical protein
MNEKGKRDRAFMSSKKMVLGAITSSEYGSIQKKDGSAFP